jgi:hypothetical protein
MVVLASLAQKGIGFSFQAKRALRNETGIKTRKMLKILRGCYSIAINENGQ